MLRIRGDSRLGRIASAARNEAILVRRIHDSTLGLE
jgi:hypothetical protein